jgi:hypothetical protein
MMRPKVSSISKSVSAKSVLRLLLFWKRGLCDSGTCTCEKGTYAKKGRPSRAPPAACSARKSETWRT